MNILSITAGAASMLCGSCLRDNALAAELLARGHHVTLLPVYTPTVTDEANMSSGQPVFFGGISVYLQQHLALFRHTPRLLDRLWDAPSVIRRFAAGAVAVNPRQLGALTVSTLRGVDGRQRKEFDKLLDWLTDGPRPQVVNLPNSLLIALAAPLREQLDCPIVVTLQGEDLFLEGLPEPYRTDARDLIKRQIETVDHFVSISEYYTEFMTTYLSIPRARVTTVPLGIRVEDFADRAPLARQPFTIGYLARIAPEKGLHTLVDAYRLLRHERGLPESRLAVAGYLGPDQREYFDGIRRQLAECGLEHEFTYAGTVDRAGKVRFLRSLDVLSVPSGYHEPKGLYLLEAMASGVPAVQPAHGAFPEMLRRTGGGLLVPSDHPSDIADGILEVWRDAARASALAEAGATGVRRAYSIRQMADGILEVYGALVAPQSARAGRPEGAAAATR
ncbi:MAG: glycosyltransferase family 4 protein [Acidobacteriota bacterium]